MAKKLVDKPDSDEHSLVDSERNLEVLREPNGTYRITKKYPSMGIEDYTIIHFKDKGDYVKVEAIIHNFVNPDSSKEFFVHKLNGSVKPVQQKRSVRRGL